MPRLLSELLRQLRLPTALGLGGAVLGGIQGALIGVLAGCLILLGLQLRQQMRLVAWLERNDGVVPPATGNGLWDEVWLNLVRQLKQQASARARLESTVRRFESAAEAIPEGVIALAPDNRITWMNSLAEKHFSLDARRDIDKMVNHLVRSPRFKDYLAAGDFRRPLLLHPTHQPSLALQVFVVAFAGEQTLILSRDVSDREQVERMRRDFVANVSHELRTPLTVVSGFIETLHELKGRAAASALPQILPLLEKQTQRMQSLVSDLLTLARLESTPEAPPMTEIDVGALVRTLMVEVDALSGNQHPLSSEIDDHLHLLGAPSEVRSVLSNLLSNAVRYTPAGSRIDIQWLRSVDMYGSPCGVFTVRDSGPGIAAEHLPRLTERFYRVDSGRSRDSGGTGLGLAIVKHVLTRHGGHLEVESTVGKGSVFRATFPPERLVTVASDQP